MEKKVLVVDDEKLIVKGIKYALEADGMSVDTAFDGEEALEKMRNNSYDICLLDVMLPKLDGFQVCQELRSFSDLPVIMLTAKGDDMDKILGLEYGADDYMTKPFNILEVKARIKAIMRRTQGGMAGDSDEVLQRSGIELHCDSHRAFIEGKEISLTSKEFEVLEFLARNHGRVYSREKLLTTIWGEDYPGDARTVDVHIRRLREKIEVDPGDPKIVVTKWGVGYYFD